MKTKRSFARSILPFLVLAMLTACASFRGNDSAPAHDGQANMTAEMEAFDMDQSTSGGAEDSASVADFNLEVGEKIIENAWLDYETTRFEETIAFIDEKIEEYNGSLEHSSRGQSSSSYGFVGDYISMTVRLPNEDLRTFIDDLNGHEDLFIQHQEISRLDVTRSYRDNETRIAILREEETALREMLQEQGSLEEVLQIRTRLSEVVTERELYEDANRTYDEQAAFSTVQIHVQQTDRADTRDVGGFWSRLADAFVDSYYRFIAVMQGFFINLVYLIPYLIILVVIGGIVWIIVKRVRKNK